MGARARHALGSSVEGVRALERSATAAQVVVYYSSHSKHACYFRHHLYFRGCEKGQSAFWKKRNIFF